MARALACLRTLLVWMPKPRCDLNLRRQSCREHRMLRLHRSLIRPRYPFHPCDGGGHRGGHGGACCSTMSMRPDPAARRRWLLRLPIVPAASSPQSTDRCQLDCFARSCSRSCRGWAVQLSLACDLPVVDVVVDPVSPASVAVAVVVVVACARHATRCVRLPCVPNHRASRCDFAVSAVIRYVRRVFHVDCGDHCCCSS